MLVRTQGVDGIRAGHRALRRPCARERRRPPELGARARRRREIPGPVRRDRVGAGPGARPTSGVEPASGRSLRPPRGWPRGGPTLRDPASGAGLRADQQIRNKCVAGLGGVGLWARPPAGRPLAGSESPVATREDSAQRQLKPIARHRGRREVTQNHYLSSTRVHESAVARGVERQLLGRAGSWACAGWFRWGARWVPGGGGLVADGGSSDVLDSAAARSRRCTSGSGFGSEAVACLARRDARARRGGGLPAGGRCGGSRRAGSRSLIRGAVAPRVAPRGSDACPLNVRNPLWERASRCGPCRNRTYNLEIKSLLLCQLS